MKSARAEVFFSLDHVSLCSDASYVLAFFVKSIYKMRMMKQNPMWLSWRLIPSSLVVSVLNAAPAVPDQVTFNQHIQPILSEACYHCHGPDSGTREPKSEPLRLDRAEYAFAKREDGKKMIDPGNPAGSEIIKRIKTTDPDDVMPPPSVHKEIKPDQLALLEKWIQQGGKYEEHWAFIAPVQPPIPLVKDQKWVKNPIDAFVREKIDAAGLSPNPTENPRRLLRRMSYDLTGLPPQVSELDAFEKDYAMDADRAVDQAAERLLASTASAEHFARQWLDAARYADTHGIHIDNYRSIWPYRDWVIQAFKQNMPWDQFTIEQIGGDLLPNAGLDQQVATGFNRCLPTTGEGGAIPEEYDAIYAKDRVDTTSAVWLGLTTGCAACHDHKFDPISTKEFYQLTAFFRNTTMTPLDRNNKDHPPVVFVPPAEDRVALKELDQQMSLLDAALKAKNTSAQSAYQAWLNQLSSMPSGSLDPSMELHLPLTEKSGAVVASLPGKKLSIDNQLARASGSDKSAVIIGKGKELVVGDVGNVRRGDSFSYGAMIEVKGETTGAVMARMNVDDKYRGWDLYLDGGKLAAHVIDQWQDNALKVTAKERLSPGWHHVFVTWQGDQKASKALSLYLDGKLVETDAGDRDVGATIHNNVPLRLGRRHPGKAGDSALNADIAIRDVRFYRRALGEAEVLLLAQTGATNTLAFSAKAERTKEQDARLYAYYLENIDPEMKDIRASQKKIQTKREQIMARGSNTLVMQEKPNSKPIAHVLTRGDYTAKAEQVEANVPKVLQPMTADMPQNRLGLGRWLVDRRNPLTARVTMNRLWNYIFGTGIVETVEDFGIMGARPTHPALLDWLAVEFMNAKWDYRHMAKMMVTSSVYRQSAVISAEKLEKDPLNRLLARAPRLRLEAESLRDGVLFASGLLSTKLGGPSVKPYQPEGIWEAVAMSQSDTRFYKQDSGESLYRRSMYTLWKRTAPPPSMEILNAPSRESFCVRRERTNTPLQAFVTLNDPQFVEASRHLAQLALQKNPDEDVALNWLAQRVLGRDLSVQDHSALKNTLRSALSYYAEHETEAKQLIGVGEKAADAQLAPGTLAAWTLVASQVINTDEALTK